VRYPWHTPCKTWYHKSEPLRSYGAEQIWVGFRARPILESMLLRRSTPQNGKRSKRSIQDELECTRRFRAKSWSNQLRKAHRMTGSKVGMADVPTECEEEAPAQCLCRVIRYSSSAARPSTSHQDGKRGVFDKNQGIGRVAQYAQ